MLFRSTPLDFSLNGNVESITAFLEKHDYKVLSTWAMNDSLANLAQAVNAEVNLVISNSGLLLAEYMFEKYNIPFVCGVPVGSGIGADLIAALDRAENIYWAAMRSSSENAECAIIGDSVYSGSLAKALTVEMGVSCRIIDPLSGSKKLLTSGDTAAAWEKVIAQEFGKADLIICDNMYLPIVPENREYIALPHEAFSGRCFHRNRLNLIDKVIDWKSLICRK